MNVKDAGKLLYGHLKKKFPQLIKDKIFNHVVYKQCCVGSELVDWLMSIAPMLNHRDHAVGIWQTLIEEEILENGRIYTYSAVTKSCYCELFNPSVSSVLLTN